MQTTISKSASDSSSIVSIETLRRRVQILTQQQARTVQMAIRSLIVSMEERDPELVRHSVRVRDLAVDLGARLGLPESRLQTLRLAAWLHDIGKQRTPDMILRKPGVLNKEEFEVIRGHPDAGVRILSPLIRSRGVLDAIQAHHERYDGNGYPNRLAGTNIPLLARIITIADSYDALTSHRCYRPALPTETAMEHLQKEAGRQFDPHLTPEFVMMMRERQEAASPTLA